MTRGRAFYLQQYLQFAQQLIGKKLYIPVHVFNIQRMTMVTKCRLNNPKATTQLLSNCVGLKRKAAHSNNKIKLRSQAAAFFGLCFLALLLFSNNTKNIDYYTDEKKVEERQQPQNQQSQPCLFLHVGPGKMGTTTIQDALMKIGTIFHLITFAFSTTSSSCSGQKL